MDIGNFIGMLPKTKIILIGAVLLAVLLTVVLAGPVLAQDASLGLNQFSQSSQLGSRPLIETVARVINVFLSILGVVIVGYFIYGGCLWMTSGGVQEKID